MFYEKLIARLPQERYSAGISGWDLKQVELTDDLKADIISAMKSEQANDQSLGMFFAKCLLDKCQDQGFISQIRDISIGRIEVSSYPVKHSALELLIMTERNLFQHRDLFMKFLSDPDATLRGMALGTYPRFARKNEYDPLLEFENDPNFSEVRMGSSHFIYPLRNQALEIIEKVIGRKFQKSEKTSIGPNGGVIVWWDWAPFHEWREGWLMGTLKRVIRGRKKKLPASE